MKILGKRRRDWRTYSVDRHTPRPTSFPCREWEHYRIRCNRCDFDIGTRVSCGVNVLGTITGYLLALRQTASSPDAFDRVLMFGALFDKDRGTKFNGVKDAVQTLAEWIDQSNGFNGHQFLIDSAGMTLRCIDNYLKRKNMTRTPPQMSFFDVRREVLGLPEAT